MSDKKDMKKAFRNAGTASDLIMKRSVLRNVRKRPEGVLFGAMPGADAAWLALPQEYCDSANDENGGKSGKENHSGEFLLLRSSGYASSELPEEVGRMAYYRAESNMAAEGGVICDIQVYIQAGRKTPEDAIRAEMHYLTEMTKKENVSISGGNTTFFGDTKDYSILISAVGRPMKDAAVHKKIEPGDKLIFFGNVGDYGAGVLAENRYDMLRERFSDSYIEEMKKGKKLSDIGALAAKLYASGCVKKMHDVSFGGIYEALFQLSNYAGCGVSVLHEGLLIRQETIELSEFFGINPYMLLGTGGLLVAAAPEHEKDILDIAEGGSIVGSFTKEGERMVYSDTFPMKRILTPVEHDEIYNVMLGE